MRRAVVVLGRQAGRQGGLELPGQKWQICPGAAIVMPVAGGQRGGVLGPLGRSWTHGTHVGQ